MLTWHNTLFQAFIKRTTKVEKISMSDPADAQRRQLLEEARLKTDDSDDECDLTNAEDNLDNEEFEEDNIIANDAENDEFPSNIVPECDDTRQKFYGKDRTIWFSRNLSLQKNV